MLGNPLALLRRSWRDPKKAVALQPHPQCSVRTGKTAVGSRARATLEEAYAS